MFAYQIQCHTDFYQVARLLSWIYHPEDTFILSIDANAVESLEALSKFLALPNVFLSERLEITWGGESLVNSLLSAVSQSLEHQNWAYFINLSGQDLPLKNREEMILTLRKHEKEGFVNFISDFGSVNFQTWYKQGSLPQRDRILSLPGNGQIALHGDVCFLASEDARSHVNFEPVVKPELRLSFYVCETSKIRLLSCRPYLKHEIKWQEDFFLNNQYHFGRQWIIAGRNLCKYIACAPKSREIYNGLRNTFIPDEAFTQTVVNTAPLELVGGTFKNNLRYFHGSPERVSDKNFRKILSSGSLFARKIDKSDCKDIIAWADDMFKRD